MPAGRRPSRTTIALRHLRCFLATVNCGRAAERLTIVQPGLGQDTRPSSSRFLGEAMG